MAILNSTQINGNLDIQSGSITISDSAYTSKTEISKSTISTTNITASNTLTAQKIDLGDSGNTKTEHDIVNSYTINKINKRLDSLGFKCGAVTIKAGVNLKLSNDLTTTITAPDGTSHSNVYVYNHIIKLGKLVGITLELSLKDSVSSGTIVVAAGSVIGSVGESFRPTNPVSQMGLTHKNSGSSTTSNGSSTSTTSYTNYTAETYTINTSGEITCTQNLIYSYSASSGKGGSGYSSTTPFVNLSIWYLT